MWLWSSIQGSFLDELKNYLLLITISQHSHCRQNTLEKMQHLPYQSDILTSFFCSWFRVFVLTAYYYNNNYYNHFTAPCLGLPGWASTRRNSTHSHLSGSSFILYQLPPPYTMIHSILSVQFTCLRVFLHNLSPSHLWSTSWSGTLHFILHTFLHPIIVFVLQHMPIPLQPVLL